MTNKANRNIIPKEIIKWIDENVRNLEKFIKGGDVPVTLTNDENWQYIKTLLCGENSNPVDFVRESLFLKQCRLKKNFEENESYLDDENKTILKEIVTRLNQYLKACHNRILPRWWPNIFDKFQPDYKSVAKNKIEYSFFHDLNIQFLLNKGILIDKSKIKNFQDKNIFDILNQVGNSIEKALKEHFANLKNKNKELFTIDQINNLNLLEEKVISHNRFLLNLFQANDQSIEEPLFYDDINRYRVDLLDIEEIREAFKFLIASKSVFLEGQVLTIINHRNESNQIEMPTKKGSL